MDISPAQRSDQHGNSGSPKRTPLEQINEFDSGVVHSEPSEHKHHLSSENVLTGLAEIRTGVSNCVVTEKSGRTPNDVPENKVLECKEPSPKDVINGEEFGSTQDMIKNHLLDHTRLPPTGMVENSNVEGLGSHLYKMAQNSLCGHLGPPPEDATNNSTNEKLVSPPEDAARNSNSKELCSVSEDATKNSGTEKYGTPPECETKDFGIEPLGSPTEDYAKNLPLEPLEPKFKDDTSNSGWAGRRNKRSAKLLKKTYMLRSVVSSDRGLQTKLQDNPKTPEPSNNLAETSTGKEKNRKKRKRAKKILSDEFSKIRKHLRYLLHRMSYEQNLIDAYSGEGWKRLSVEKLKPEKELQRAASEIFRCKLKVRDVFQRLHLMLAEGRFPESLFDSDGQIDSEDIFCAKCGSKELSAGNDIILCDGACERGFHQFCLQPPLLQEEIPPDDEGWLCPGCDCKVDCIELLNDSQGATLSITDTWEKVFPEAAAAAAGENMQDENFESDDDEDDDYDPETKEVDEKILEDDSSSDDSDFTSASDELGAPASDEGLLGLPSDDSEDDDYDPTAPDRDDQSHQESSSSDFTSDSEDLAAALDGDGGPIYSSLDQTDSTPVSGRRHVERLDYKKLYDDTYENVPSSSSGDEDWTDTVASSKKSGSGKVATGTPGGNVPSTRNKKNTKGLKHDQKNTEHPSKRRNRQKLSFNSTDNSPAKLQKDSPASGSTGKRSSYKRYGEEVTQRLYKFFKENQYPDRAAKENMGKELGLTAYQVSKWFENARWSSRHPSGNKQLDPESEMKPRGAVCNGVESKESPKVGATIEGSCSNDKREKNMATEESSGQKSTTPSSRKRKSKSKIGVEETPKPPVDSPQTRSGRKSGRIQTRSRSVS